jgi:2'-hydroxyisoflavone reductase
MRLLVLGGTAFLGRAVAGHAVAAGHDVTCAARGKSGPVADGATLVRVDRADPDALATLEGRDFDAAIDVSSIPSQVRRAVAALADRVGHFTYISTGSVYSDPKTMGQRARTAPVVPAAPPEVDDPAADNHAQYGPCKMACEQSVLGAFGGRRSFICRAGLIVGPEDDSDRFTYWPVRLARPGPVLAPGAPDEMVQFIDVRDLASWIVQSADTGLRGVYDGIGAPMTRGEFLTRVAAGVGSPDPELVWVDQSFLSEQQVRPWMGERSLPLWVPMPDYGGFMTQDVRESLSAGLATREVETTAADTLAWYRGNGSPPLGCGLDPADEESVLDAWSALS